PTGGTHTISWNMGNGVVYNDNRQSVNISYPNSGLYVVTATMTSNEYPPVVKTFPMLVNSPLSVSICVDGPVSVDLCGAYPPSYGTCTVNNNNPYSGTEFIAQINGSGCQGVYSYHWEFKQTTHTNWSTFGGNSDRALFFGGFESQPTSYQIRCTVTDVCNSSVVSSSFLDYYQSTPGCGGGWGGIGITSDGSDN
ncbi:hypothetical protein MM239_20550, partial [Belliella sp. DSM 111904]